MNYNTLKELYIERKKAKCFIYGFVFNKAVYYAVSDEFLTSDTKASRGRGLSLRFRPTREVKQSLLENAVYLCSLDTFNNAVNGNKYNKGENFEQLIYKLNGQEWVKDSVPFYDGVDIEIDGIGYEMKFEGATFITESTANNLLARV